MADVVRHDVALRRALTDASVEGEHKAGLARAVFGKALDEPALDAASPTPCARRWIAGADLPDALERVAVAATVRSAGAKGEQVGDELFAVRRIIDENPSLRGALADNSRTAEDRSALLLGLLDDQTLPGHRACSSARP